MVVGSLRGVAYHFDSGHWNRADERSRPCWSRRGRESGFTIVSWIALSTWHLCGALLWHVDALHSPNRARVLCVNCTRVSIWCNQESGTNSRWTNNRGDIGGVGAEYRNNERKRRRKRDGKWRTVARNKRREERMAKGKREGQMDRERGRGRGHTTRAQKRSKRARGSFVRGTVSGTALRPAILFSWAGTRLNARLPQYRWNLGRPPSWLHHFDPIASSCRNVEQHCQWRGSYSFRIQLPVPRPVSGSTAISDSKTPLSRSDVLRINLRELSPIIFSLDDVD